MKKRKGSKKKNVEVRDRVSDPDPDPVFFLGSDVFSWIRIRFPIQFSNLPGSESGF